MLESAEVAAAKAVKAEKKEAAFGWDSFNTKSLYNAYDKRASKIEVGAMVWGLGYLCVRVRVCVWGDLSNTKSLYNIAA